ncbi:hypothetical protein FQ330_00240 [Agrococcus sediminis]|uniref:Uncharacterized protein n=1 Tax=Agrococcus sediminis TaxID=2599924 RepID=A0A5M8QSF3_9MICO|nr:hypothetical protein [Agrococcus sediminis]KAA6437960.1 hypothetical protein FQ330_00240 [Agrococcus sediminis]
MSWARTSVGNTDELEQARLIERRLQQGRLIRARFEIVSNRGVGSGSELAADDEATKWMHLSHVVTTALMMATDNMRAIDGLLRPAKTLEVPMYAHYPIVRSILEASSLAKWILVPAARGDRIERLLRARFDDIAQDASLAKVELDALQNMDEPPGNDVLGRQRRLDTKRHDRDVAKAREIAAAHDIPWARVKQGLPPWVHLIRSVCVVPAGAHGMRVPGDYAAMLWKVASGLSHPSHSRSARNSDLERLSESADGVSRVRLTASLRWTHEAILVAYNTTQEAVSLLESRGAPQLPASFHRR